MVELISMKCPNCKADIEVKEGINFCYCTYCGTKILVHDDSVHTENINITHNDISAVERDRLKYQHENAQNTSKNNLIETGMMYGLLVLMFIVILLLNLFG
ncbi:hypothetical protein [Lachnoclostridium sp. Marseille-P6806]|uniref:hypothetical protein n=1 Tax=Lachnoclostridium sp. Marseille-P6806 TaxID=2364793 RepID=UPI00102F872B|nr:hypothetical protein [Lachnoclostridium sp. Marseille-P6806]